MNPGAAHQPSASDLDAPVHVENALCQRFRTLRAVSYTVVFWCQPITARSGCHAPHCVGAEYLRSATFSPFPRGRWSSKRDALEDGCGLDYQSNLSVAQGVKIGGWEPWSFRDPHTEMCPTCDSPMQPFIYIDSGEWDADKRWMPLEDGLPGAAQAPSINIGRSYGMQIYTCPASFDHPHTEVMQ